MRAENRFACATQTFAADFATRVDAIKRAGFAALELHPRDLYEKYHTAEGSIELLRESGVSIACFQHLGSYEGNSRGERDVKLEVAKLLLMMMKLSGADLLIVSSNKTAPPGDWAQAIEDFRILGDLGKSQNVRIGFEALSYAPWINDYRMAWQMVKDVDHSHVGLVLDAAHTFVRKAPLEPISDIPGDRIFLVEVADLPTCNLSGREVARYYRLFPGEGTQPIREFIERAEGTGYSGYYSVEIFSSHYEVMDPYEVAKRAFDAVSSVMP